MTVGEALLHKEGASLVDQVGLREVVGVASLMVGEEASHQEVVLPCLGAVGEASQEVVLPCLGVEGEPC